MITRHVWLIAGFAVAAGCTDSVGPRIARRWAAPGIELQATNAIVELRMPCAPPFRAPVFLVVTRDRIEFMGRVDEFWYQYDFTFQGRFVGDTLSATLIRKVPGLDPSVSTHLMTPDGDSGLDRIACLA